MDRDFNLDLVTEDTVWSDAPVSRETVWDDNMNQLEWEQLLEDTQYVIK